MKALLIGFLLIGFSACGEHTAYIYYPVNGIDGKDGISLVANSNYDDIACLGAGGTITTIAQDINNSGLVDDGDLVQTQYLTCNGNSGIDGQDGLNGTDGTDGLSCSVNKVGALTTLSCGTSNVVISDGIKGEPGISGSVVSVVQLCAGSGNFKEIALKVDNKLIAFFQETTSITVNAPGGQTSVINGLKGRLAVLVNGSYSTTDSQPCNFTVLNGNLQ